MYHVARYRRQVVDENIASAFPNQSPEERAVIARRFYRNFCDNWVETLKLLSISPQRFRKRVVLDVSAAERFAAQGRSVVEVAGHQFNFEMISMAFGLMLPFTQVTVYMPLTSKVMDRLFRHLRARMGTVLISATEMGQQYTPWRHKPHGLGLAADQSPASPESGFWLWFLNQPTSFVKGPERLGRTANMPVLFFTFSKAQRGYYRFDCEVLCENPRQTAQGDITRLFARKLEQVIENDPALYMWSHKRWKHNWKPEYSRLWVDERPMPAS